MSMSFTKLFSSITESSVWFEPDHVRLAWITLLAMADRKGRVFASIPGLAHRARIKVEEAQDAITRFLSPDPFSRTKDHEGRRIEEIDGGWRLLNYLKFRQLRDEEAAKESKRHYINERRASGSTISTVEHSRLSASASVCASASESEIPVGKGVRGKRFPPTIEDARSSVPLGTGFTVEFIDKTWLQAQARGGCDSRGNPIRDFASHLAVCWKYEREKLAKTKPGPEPKQIKEYIEPKNL